MSFILQGGKFHHHLLPSNHLGVKENLVLTIRRGITHFFPFSPSFYFFFWNDWINFAWLSLLFSNFIPKPHPRTVVFGFAFRCFRTFIQLALLSLHREGERKGGQLFQSRITFSPFATEFCQFFSGSFSYRISLQHATDLYDNMKCKFCLLGLRLNIVKVGSAKNLTSDGAKLQVIWFT